MNDDRISELYKGEIWSEALQDRARRRVHWICGNVTGERVLDIGCSQGIVPILLGREGFEVFGVDVQADRIEYAQDDLAQESPSVQELVSFSIGNGADLDFSDASFDTVVLGEVIEHLTQPDRVLAEARRVLKNGGTLVLTTPFGISKHHDHRQTFYPFALVDLIAPRFEITSVTVVDRYFRLVARKSDTAGPVGITGIENGIDMAIESLDRSVVSSGLEIEKLRHAHESQVEELRGEITEMIAALVKRDEAIADVMDDNAQLAESVKAAQDQVESVSLQATKSAAYVQHLKLQKQNLFRRAELLKHQVATERWKLRSTKSRKWWRMGQALSAVKRQPWRIFVVPFDWVSIAFGKSDLPKRPVPPLWIGAESKERKKDHPAESETTAQLGESQEGDSLLERVEAARLSDPDSKPKRDLRVAALLDEFSLSLFEPEFHITEVTPENWSDVARAGSDLLLVESAWRGKDDVWLGQLAKLEGPSEVFKAMVQGFKEQGIPTVFWNKEDPPNYDLYVKAASCFDVVLTVAEESIPDYIEDLGHDRIAMLPFSVQPAIHNPTAPDDRIGGVSFAGTYYAKKHPQRVDQVEAVLDPARKFPLTIYSRVASAGNYQWPDRFTEFVKGTLEYKDVLTAYKMHDVFVNVNSVVDSESMCARRVFELAASGTPVVSGTSPAITRFFDDIVFQAGDAKAAENAFRALLQSEELRKRTALRGVREVMRHHTASHRVTQMLKALGIADTWEETLPPVSLVLPTNRPGQVDYVIDMISDQTYPNLQLVIAAHGFELSAQNLKRKAGSTTLDSVEVVEVGADQTLGDVINHGFERAEGEYIGKIDDDNFYGPEFTWDLMDCFKFTDASIVGKWTHFTYVEGMNALVLRFPGSEYRYVDLVAGSAMIVDREVFEAVKFPSQPVGEDTKFLRDAKRAGAGIYSGDRFNYVYMRYQDADHHTFNASDLELASKGELLQFGLNLDHVTV